MSSLLWTNAGAFSLSLLLAASQPQPASASLPVNICASFNTADMGKSMFHPRFYLEATSLLNNKQTSAFTRPTDCAMISVFRITPTPLPSRKRAGVQTIRRTRVSRLIPTIVILPALPGPMRNAVVRASLDTSK